MADGAAEAAEDDEEVVEDGTVEEIDCVVDVAAAEGSDDDDEGDEGEVGAAAVAVGGDDVDCVVDAAMGRVEVDDDCVVEAVDVDEVELDAAGVPAAD